MRHGKDTCEKAPHVRRLHLKAQAEDQEYDTRTAARTSHKPYYGDHGVQVAFLGHITSWQDAKRGAFRLVPGY